MTAQRVIKGLFCAHAGEVFALLETKQPYDIPGTAALMRRAASCSGGNLGTITVHMVEHESFPKTQGFTVLSDRHRADRALFAQAVSLLFPGCKLEIEWATGTLQDNDRLFLAVVYRELLRLRQS